MSDPIDPRLYASSLPPRSQSYTTGHTPQNGAQPYYLPSPVQQQQQPPLSQTGAPTIDPALDPTIQTSPVDHDVSHDEDDHDGDGEDTPAASGSAKSPGDLKRPRACDSCRGLKVRCDQDNPAQPCKRCAKAGRPCITTPPTRKRQKKADSRVAELERKIDALTATLHAQKSGAPDFRSPATVPHGPINPSGVPTSEGSYRLGSLNHDWSNSPATRYPDIPPGYGPAVQRGPEPKRRKLDDGNSHASFSEDMDALHRDLTEHPEMKRARKGQHTDHSHINTLVDQLVSPDLAESIFFRYVNDICPHFPAVPIAPGTTARELRDKKPLLFLAIVAGSSHGSSEPLVSQDVQRELTKLLKDQLADVIWRNGEKSLEIVQSLQVAVLWYRPPLHFEQHNFYMMVNVAAVMALDLGLGRRATPNVMKLAVGPFRRYHPNSGSVESRRTFLVCYYLCMSITMVLRRPILLRWTKYMEESVKILETSPDAYPSDKVLVQHVKMAHIGENISVQFSMDDPSVDVAISEPKVIYALKIFENELQQLRDENAKMDGNDPAIRLSEHVINLYLHEIALHNNHGAAADFQPPFSEFGPPASNKKEAIGPAHIGALGECLTATHGILDTILGIPFEILVTLPVIFCVRSIYAIVCLMKMWVSVTSSSEVGSIIRKEHLQLESYSERLVNMFNAIVSQDAQSPHGKFYFVAKRLQERFVQIQEGASKEQSEGNEESRHQSNLSAAKSQSGPTPSSQTPLHLLSEVAMGSSNQPQTQAQSQASTQQGQAGVQPSPAASQQPIQQGWYLGMSQPSTDVVGMPQSGFDPNFDFTQFDLSMGSDADLSALFIPDSMLWNFQPDPMPGYGSF